MTSSISRRFTIALAASLLALGLIAGIIKAGYSITPAERQDALELAKSEPVALLNRLTWGADVSSFYYLNAIGSKSFIEQQLHPSQKAPLPPAVQAQIDNMVIAKKPLAQLLFGIHRQVAAIDAIQDQDAKDLAEHDLQEQLDKLGREAASRFVLRALYSKDQLKEQLTWFWMNHFNIFQHYENVVRAMIGDFEERAIRPHALGRFRDLLFTTIRHPAMLRFLDNEQNSISGVNENFARELLELHTLGINAGYNQRDVQELARILTGLGINETEEIPRLPVKLEKQYLREGVFEFNPARHDYGDKEFLGVKVKGRGLAEIDEVIDRLSRAPETAKFISRKLAIYFLQDDPSPGIVDQMAQVFLQSDGDIAATISNVVFRTRISCIARNEV